MTFQGARLWLARKFAFCLLWALPLVSTSSQTYAGLLFSLTTNAADPTHIAVGDTVHIELAVSGILDGEELVALSGRFVIDPAIFEVSQVSFGAIVPDPLADPLDLLALSGDGFADVTFLTLSNSPADHVTSNGVFYIVALKALSFGSAGAEIAFADALQVDPSDPQALITPDIQISAPLVLHVVPECSTLVLGILGFLGLMLRGRGCFSR